MPIVHHSEMNTSDLISSQNTFLEAIKNGDELFLDHHDYLASYYEVVDEQGNNLLHLAVESGSAGLVKRILEDNILNPNAVNHEKKDASLFGGL